MVARGGEDRQGRAGVRRMRHATYADLCKVLTTELILAVAHAFWFADEDAPCDKIHRYVAAMR